MQATHQEWGNLNRLLRLGVRSLLGHCITLFKLTGLEKIVVISGHRATDVAEEANHYGLQPIFNPDYDSGMFSSVCAALPHLQGLDGFFMLPVDIPLVRPVTARSLQERFDGTQVLYPTRGEEKGHPPLIPTSIIPSLLQHDGSGGLQQALAEFPGSNIPVWDDGAFMDSDTAEDFTLLQKRFAAMAVGSRQEAETLAELAMPPKGVAHGRAVAEVADRLCKELASAGCSLDAGIVHNGALLHDIGKGAANHEEEGAKMMQRLGLYALVEAVGAHRDAERQDGKQLGEKEVVCLADKLVSGARRVSVRQRFNEKLEIYKDDHRACMTIRRRLNNAPRTSGSCGEDNWKAA